MKKLLITALALSAGLSACTSEAPVEADDATSQNTEAPKAELVSFNVSGMTWQTMCGGAVRSAISESCGLSEDSIVVSKDDGTVTVPKDSGVDKDKVAAALEGTKYSVQ